MTTPRHQDPATAAQVHYIKYLLSSKIMPADRVPPGFDPNTYDPSRLTKGAAGRFIETLKALEPQPHMLPKGSVRADQTELQAGFYVMGNKVFKVLRAVHGSGHLYAKVLEYPRDGEAKGHWVHAPGAMRELREFGTPLTLQLAQELGKLYGMCVRCGAILTDEDSIERNMGPVCFAKMGGN